MTTVYPGAHTDRIETLERLVAEQDRRIRDLEYALLSAAGQALVGASLCDATQIENHSVPFEVRANPDNFLCYSCGIPVVNRGARYCDRCWAARDQLPVHLHGSSILQHLRDTQGTAAAAPTVHPLPVATSSEPLMAEERYSAPSRNLGDAIATFHDRHCSYHLGAECDCTAWGDSAAPGAAPLAPTFAAVSQGTVNQSQEQPFFRPGDRCAVYTGGDPCVKPGTVEAQEHDGRWLISIDRAGKIRATEEEMVFLPESWR